MKRSAGASWKSRGKLLALFNGSLKVLSEEMGNLNHIYHSSREVSFGGIQSNDSLFPHKNPRLKAAKEESLRPHARVTPRIEIVRPFKSTLLHYSLPKTRTIPVLWNVSVMWIVNRLPEKCWSSQVNTRHNYRRITAKV